MIDPRKGRILALRLNSHCLICLIYVNANVIFVHHSCHSKCNCAPSYVAAWTECATSSKGPVGFRAKKLRVRKEAVRLKPKGLWSPDIFIAMELVEWNLRVVSRSKNCVGISGTDHDFASWLQYFIANGSRLDNVTNQRTGNG